VLARNSVGKYLLAEPNEYPGPFFPVQGGLEIDESLLCCAARELKEETALQVCPDRITLVDGMRYRNTRPVDGFRFGKLFFGCFVEFDERNRKYGNVRPNRDEIMSTLLAPPEEVLRILDRNVERRPETAPKAEFIAHLLDKAQRL
jgi:8-oxo-dGTP pyrophosphatase MutT (NUDIX family)